MMWLRLLLRVLTTGWRLRRPVDRARIICVPMIPVPVVLRYARMALSIVLTERRCVPTATVSIGRSRTFCVFGS